jgi:hypothetical protein
VLLQQIVIDARLIIKAVEKAGGDQLNQVAVAFVAFSEQDEMVLALRVSAAILVIVGRDVNFAPDDRLHAVRLSLMEKVSRSKKVSVVSNRYRRHAPACRLGRQFADFASAVEERVIRVQM